MNHTCSSMLVNLLAVFNSITESVTLRDSRSSFSFSTGFCKSKASLSRNRTLVRG